jgi:hypothetical protein
MCIDCHDKFNMTLTYYLVNKHNKNVCIRSKDSYDNNNVLHNVNVSLGPSLTLSSFVSSSIWVQP